MYRDQDVEYILEARIKLDLRTILCCSLLFSEFFGSAGFTPTIFLCIICESILKSNCNVTSRPVWWLYLFQQITSEGMLDITRFNLDIFNRICSGTFIAGENVVLMDNYKDHNGIVKWYPDMLWWHSQTSWHSHPKFISALSTPLWKKTKHGFIIFSESEYRYPGLRKIID